MSEFLYIFPQALWHLNQYICFALELKHVFLPSWHWQFCLSQWLFHHDGMYVSILVCFSPALWHLNPLFFPPLTSHCLHFFLPWLYTDISFFSRLSFSQWRYIFSRWLHIFFPSGFFHRDGNIISTAPSIICARKQARLSSSSRPIYPRHPKPHPSSLFCPKPRA